MNDSRHTGRHRLDLPANPYPPTQPRMYPPAQEPFTPAPVAPARPGALRWALLGLVAGVVIAGPVGCSVGRLSALPVARSAAEISSPSPTRKITPIPVPSSSASSTRRREPTRKDFKVSLKELGRECFPPVGCNVTYRPQLKTERADLLMPGVVYEITYKVTGGDAPETGRFLLEDGEYERSEETAGVPRQTSKLSATVTGVEVIG